MNWYIEVLKKYTEFSGRARRKEYWYFVLFNIIVSFIFIEADSFSDKSTAPRIALLI